MVRQAGRQAEAARETEQERGDLFARQTKGTWWCAISRARAQLESNELLDVWQLRTSSASWRS